MASRVLKEKLFDVDFSSIAVVIDDETKLVFESDDGKDFFF